VYLGALAEWTYSLPAAILILSLVLYPLSMLATEVAVRRVDGRLEEAALVHAPAARVLRRITLPLIAPSTMAAALLIFVLAVSEFGVPGLLRVRVYTTEVFTAFAALYDVGTAIALTVPLLILCTCVAVLAVLLVGDRVIGRRALKGRHPELFERWRRPLEGFAVVVLSSALGLPLMVLAKEAVGVGSPSRVFIGSGGAIANSLVLSVLGATLVVCVAVWLGYSRARAQRGVGRFTDVVYVVLFAVPSTVVGVGLIGLWNRPGLLGSVYGTHAMLLIAYLARFVPLAALVLSASARYVSASQEEAAAASGAGWARTMSRIVLPQMRSGIAVAWMIVFVMAFGELGVSILIAPPGDATLPIRIYTMIANAPSSQVAAFALLQTTVVLVGVVALGARAIRREAA
jgi:iron(III) transport system permease protein